MHIVPSFATGTLIGVLLGVVMFGMGLATRPDDFKVVILPICLGFAARRFFPKATERTVRYMPTVSSVAIAAIIALVLAANADRLAKGGLAVLVVVILHNVCGLALGYLVAAALRLSEPKRRALCIEVGMQNSGLAASLAAAHFAAYPMAAIPGAIFSVWHNVSGAVAARLFNRHAGTVERERGK